MANPVYIFIVGLAFASLPIGWYDGVDGYFNDPQHAVVDQNLPMLSVSLDKPSIKCVPGDTQVKAKVYNNSAATVYLVEVGVMARDFNFEIKDASGAVIQPNKLFEQRRNDPISMCMTRELKPGDYSFYIINLSKYYDIDPKKTYTVQLWRDFLVSENPRKDENAASNVLQIGGLK